ncbi:MAG: DUF3568 family protein [Verrucomicrobia bacterium]|nr:MAG: DUF3568 family protein [Verrucomicrobiota bacterium]
MKSKMMTRFGNGRKPAPAAALSRASRLLVGLMLGIALLAQSGCALFVVGGAVAVGAGGYAYYSGELKGVESAPLDKVFDASVAAMGDLKFPITSQQKDAINGQLTARTATDLKVSIRFKAVSENTTEVRIRVGSFGDRALSYTVLENIRKHM